MSQKTLTISVVAKQLGISVETIRYYQRIQLIDTPKKPVSGYRIYSQDIIIRLSFIQRAKELGFTLAEIATLLELGSAQCSQTKALASLKLDMINEKINDLQAIANTLSHLIKDCSNNKNPQICPIINAIKPSK